MKKLLLFSGLLFLIMPQTTYASTTVRIENSGGSNSVNVKSNTSANHQQSGSTNIESHVYINENGEKKEFHSSNGEDINYKSDNTTVNINNNSTNSSPSPKTSPKPGTSASPSPETKQSASPSADILGVKSVDEVREENKNLVDWIREFFLQISSVFK